MDNLIQHYSPQCSAECEESQRTKLCRAQKGVKERVGAAKIKVKKHKYKFHCDP